MRRLGWLAAVLLAFASGAAATHAAPVPPVAGQGVLGSETVLTWTGAKAIRLTVPRQTYYRDANVDLVVTGASYAFVRLMAPYQPGCPAQYGPRCLTDRVNWVRGVNDAPGTSRSRQHDALLSSPAVIARGHLDVYLFTDGHATLTIKTTSLRGRTAYRPGARFRGYAGPLPTTCVPLGCADAAGRSNGLTYGGQTYDLRGAGWAEYYAANHSDSHAATNQLHSVSGCLFPNWDHPQASPEAADHPLGCGETGDPKSATDAALLAAQAHAGSAAPGQAYATNVPWSGARGRQYIGFQAIGGGPAPARAVGYGIWFRFLS